MPGLAHEKGKRGPDSAQAVFNGYVQRRLLFVEMLQWQAENTPGSCCAPGEFTPSLPVHSVQAPHLPTTKNQEGDQRSSGLPAIVLSRL